MATSSGAWVWGPRPSRVGIPTGSTLRRSGLIVLGSHGPLVSPSLWTTMASVSSMAPVLWSPRSPSLWSARATPLRWWLLVTSLIIHLPLLGSILWPLRSILASLLWATCRCTSCIIIASIGIASWRVLLIVARGRVGRIGSLIGTRSLLSLLGIPRWGLGIVSRRVWRVMLGRCVMLRSWILPIPCGCLRLLCCCLTILGTLWCILGLLLVPCCLLLHISSCCRRGLLGVIGTCEVNIPCV